MRTKFVAILAPAVALGFLAVSAEAQQHKATRLGNPATRFAKPLKKADDLRVMLRSEKTKADVAAILNEAGWKGNLEDLDRAAATAEISEIQIPTGTRIPFMSSRKNKKPHALVDVLWAGAAGAVSRSSFPGPARPPPRFVKYDLAPAAQHRQQPVCESPRASVPMG